MRAAALSAPRAAVALLGCAGVLSAPPLRAFEQDVTATTAAQFYALSSPYGDPTVRRRRLTQTLGLGLYDLTDALDPFAPRLDVRVRMRLDADLGQENPERDPSQLERFVPGLEQAPVDVMYAYVEGRNYFDGHLGFRAGRQYVTDSLGFWSFDGGMLRLSTPAFVQAEVYGGFEQRGGVPLLSTDRFETDGVYRGDRSALETREWPSYLEEKALAPAYGFAIESTGVHFVHGRVSYRKVVNRDTVLISPFADTGGGYLTVSGARTSTERLGYSARASAPSLGSIKGTVVYDFLMDDVTEYDAALDWYLAEQITLGGAVEYYLPTFDGDSIWNWFTHNGSTTITGRVAWLPSRRFDVALTGGTRLFFTDGDPATYALYQNPRAPTEPDPGSVKQVSEPLGTLSGNYRWSDGRVGVRSMGQTGTRGHRYGGDVSGTHYFDEKQYDATAVVSLYDWEDGLRPHRGAQSFTYVVGGGVSPFERTRFGVEWEHSMNRLVGQRYRMLATLEIGVLR